MSPVRPPPGPPHRPGEEEEALPDTALREGAGQTGGAGAPEPTVGDQKEAAQRRSRNRAIGATLLAGLVAAAVVFVMVPPAPKARRLSQAREYLAALAGVCLVATVWLGSLIIKLRRLKRAFETPRTVTPNPEPRQSPSAGYGPERAVVAGDMEVAAVVVGTCTRCGEGLSEESRFCGACGAEASDGVEPQKLPEIPATDKPQEKQKPCSGCGEMLDVVAFWCPHCSVRQPVESLSVASTEVVPHHYSRGRVILLVILAAPGLALTGAIVGAAGVIVGFFVAIIGGDIFGGGKFSVWSRLLQVVFDYPHYFIILGAIGLPLGTLILVAISSVFKKSVPPDDVAPK